MSAYTVRGDTASAVAVSGIVSNGTGGVILEFLSPTGETEPGFAVDPVF